MRCFSSEATSSTIFKEVEQQITSAPVVVFSKTYCPYCAEVLDLLKDIDPPAKVIQLDQEDYGVWRQDALEDITDQRTVPNIFIEGRHIGGCDDLHTGIKSGEVQKKLDAANIKHNF